MKPPICACGEIARPKQRNCYRCHAAANQVYRARVKHSAEKVKKLAIKMMSLNIRLAQALEE